MRGSGMKRKRSFTKDDSGNFTVEASMIFPMILIITMCLIFFSLVVYYKSILQFEANRIADKVAFVWNNSSKDVHTGAFNQYTTQNGDGLYWRLTSNNILQNFGLNIGGESAAVDKKLHRNLVDEIPGAISGSVEFKNKLFRNYVEVKLEQPLKLPSMVTDLFKMDVMEASAARTITEPVEFIRNTDFVIYVYKDIEKYQGYITQFKSKKK